MIVSCLQEANTTKRAQSVLNSASLLGVHQFIKPTDIVKGNPRLNLAFTAAIFNTCPGLEPLTEEQVYHSLLI
jgi:plastin-1